MPQMRSKSFLTSNITTLYREVNGRVRYYSINTYLTLFGDYLLIREWGDTDNKNATGEKWTFFKSYEEMVIAVKRIISMKQTKGYGTSN